MNQAPERHPNAALPLEIQAVLNQPGSPFKGFVPDHQHESWAGIPWTPTRLTFGFLPDGNAACIATANLRKEIGQLVGDWARSGRSATRPSRTQHLIFLQTVLGLPLNPEARLRYEFLHHAAAGLLGSRLAGLGPCLLLIRSPIPEHFEDYSAFVEAMARSHQVEIAIERDQVLGPVRPNMHRELIPQTTQLYFAWVSSTPPSAAQSSGQRTRRAHVLEGHDTA